MNYHKTRADRKGNFKLNIKIGCCGFSEAHHKYYLDFDTVEIQNTFFQPPRINVAKKWRASAPKKFEFTLRAWQLITHQPSSAGYKRLRIPIPYRQKPKYGFFLPTREVHSSWETSKVFASALEAKFILFQCPTNFHPIKENLRNLKKFFQSINRAAINPVLETNGSWDKEMLKDICCELNLIHAVDPFQSESVSDSLRYYRLYGLRGFRYKYSDDDLLKLKEICSNDADRKIFCLFNNASMNEDARRFKTLIGS